MGQPFYLLRSGRTSLGYGRNTYLRGISISPMRLQNPDGINELWREPDALRVPPFRIMGDLYYVGNRDVSSHLLTSDEGHILIDTGFATTVPLLVESVRSLGFSERDIELILNTHGHEDHAGGNRRMIEATGAENAIGRRDVETVEEGTEMTCGYYIYGVESFETYEVDMALDGGEEFIRGDNRVRVHNTPGHTPGTCSYEIPLGHEGEELTGFLFGGPGQWTFRRRNRSQGYEGDMDDYRRTLDYLKGIDVDVPLGAHPDQSRTFEKHEAALSGSETNPFIDPDHWERFIGRLEENFRLVLEEWRDA